MIRSRALLSLLLSFCLVLWPVGMASMGLGTGPGGVLADLCSGDAAAKSDQPTAPGIPDGARDCPTCLAQPAVALVAALNTPDRPAQWSDAATCPAEASRAALVPASASQARAPPLVI